MPWWFSPGPAATQTKKRFYGQASTGMEAGSDGEESTGSTCSTRSWRQSAPICKAERLSVGGLGLVWKKCLVEDVLREGTVWKTNMSVSQNRGSRWGSEISSNHVTVLGRFMSCQMLQRVVAVIVSVFKLKSQTGPRQPETGRRCDDGVCLRWAHDWQKLPLSIRNRYLFRVQDTARGGPQ